MDKPVEILLFDFFDEALEAAVEGDALFGVQLHDTVYQTIKKTGKPATDRVIRIGEAVSDLDPGCCFAERSANLTLVLAVRIQGKDKTERQTALIDLFKLQKAVAELLEDRSLGDRVDDLEFESAFRGYDTFDGDAYAVANIPMVINPW